MHTWTNNWIKCRDLSKLITNLLNDLYLTENTQIHAANSIRENANQKIGVHCTVNICEIDEWLSGFI